MDLEVAIVALLTVGVILLNLGVDIIKAGDAGMGLVVIAAGAGLIVLAVVLVKLMAEKVVEAKISG